MLSVTEKLLADLSANKSSVSTMGKCFFTVSITSDGCLLWIKPPVFLWMDGSGLSGNLYFPTPLQEIRGREPKHHIFAAMTAFHLYDCIGTIVFADVAELLLFRILPIKNGCSPAHNVEIPFIRKSVHIME